MGLESAHNGYLQATGSPGSPPASLAEMISRNKMLEGKKHIARGSRSRRFDDFLRVRIN